MKVRLIAFVTILLELALIGQPTVIAQESADAPRTLPSVNENRGDEPPISLDNRVTPDQVAAKAFAPPPGAKSLSQRNVWIDLKSKRVFLDGYIAMRDGPLEMFACPTGTKEHESIVATMAKSSDVHAALLAIGAQTGTTVRFLPRYVPATGQRIRVWVCYYGNNDKGQSVPTTETSEVLPLGSKFEVADARSWIVKTGTEQQMVVDWVFAGSGFWKDPADNREYYRADSGDMICVSNFATAMIDVPVPSSAEARDLEFSPATEKIPPRGTPVRLVLEPIPLITDADQGKTKEPVAPTQEVVPKK